MVVVAIHDRDVHFDVAKGARCGEAAESGADDHDTWMLGHVLPAVAVFPQATAIIRGWRPSTIDAVTGKEI